MSQRVLPKGIVAVRPQPRRRIQRQRLTGGGRFVEPLQQAGDTARPAGDKQRREHLRWQLELPGIGEDIGARPRRLPEKRRMKRRQILPPRTALSPGKGDVGQEEEQVLGGQPTRIGQFPVDHPHLAVGKNDDVRMAQITVFEDGRDACRA